MSNKELDEESHKSIIRKFKKRKVYSCIIDNIWDAYLTGMQLINKFDIAILFLLWLLIFLDESNRKPNKIWADKGSELYNRPIKSQLQENNIEMYSIHDEVKAVVAKRFIRTLQNKIYKYMTSVSKNKYINNILDDTDNKYNNTYHRTI